MAATKRKPRKVDTGGERIAPPAPAFMRKGELGRELGIDRKTIDRLIASGTIPPPHSRPGPKIALWRREHYEHFKAHRAWPREAFPSG